MDIKFKPSENVELIQKHYARIGCQKGLSAISQERLMVLS